MAVHDRWFASVLGRPVPPHWKSEFVRFARRIAEKCKFANSSRSAPDHLFFKSRVGDGKLSTIQPVVAAHRVEERLCTLPEGIAL